MTTHELARQLLAGPDATTIASLALEKLVEIDQALSDFYQADVQRPYKPNSFTIPEPIEVEVALAYNPRPDEIGPQGAVFYSGSVRICLEGQRRRAIKSWPAEATRPGPTFPPEADPGRFDGA